ncbi:hypothetical protein [Pedobacter sp. BMA]|uniref:hypothetical protein n=1 Tax=Pedobacter sp. BMA TaxID=1663685 RepID=UPI00064A57EE|nr:hypothetical protein [Pedobacter sp. BMA]KLT66958.1 hypothetical protein AB669_03280 [Pedobacter sp. BMA]
MENEILAIQYLENKEKALAERAEIDLELKPALAEADQDKSAAGKQATEALKTTIDLKESAFQQTVEGMTLIFSEFFPVLQTLGATKDNPYHIFYHEKDYGFYIDDNKNIHYT